MVKVSCIERFLEQWRKAARQEYWSALGECRACLAERPAPCSGAAAPAAVQEAVRAKYSAKVGIFIGRHLEDDDDTVLKKLREYMAEDTAQMRADLYHTVQEAVGTVRWGTHMITGVNGDIAGYVAGSSGTAVVCVTCRKAGYRLTVRNVAHVSLPPTQEERQVDLLAGLIAQVQKGYERAHRQALDTLGKAQSALWRECGGEKAATGYWNDQHGNEQE